jgi:UDP-glucose:(heptosyl)LPS alpha-1,3-glucosyltransferase
MRFGIVRRGFSASGGAERYAERFAAAARAAGHDCVLFCSQPWPQDHWPGQSIVLRGRDPIEFADALEKCSPKGYCDYLFSLDRVWRADAYRAGDGVHRAWLQRRKEFEGAWKGMFRWASGKHRALLKLERSLFQGGAQVVIANSRLVKGQIEACYQTPGSKIRVVHNGTVPFKADWKARLRLCEEIGMRSDACAVLFAGSGWERKGLKYAIEAVNRVKIPKVVLLVAGRGKKAGLPGSRRVAFLGERSDMDSLYSAADLFLLPTWYDPFSNACLEAMVAGLPVITTGSNGFSELIKPGIHGEVVKSPRNVEGLTSALEKWAPLGRRMEARRALRDYGTRFLIEENLNQTLAIIYQEMGLDSENSGARGEGWRPD